MHKLVFHTTCESMQFCSTASIEMSIKDHLWNSTAQGWAFHAANDPKMAHSLTDAERQRNSNHDEPRACPALRETVRPERRSP